MPQDSQRYTYMPLYLFSDRKRVTATTYTTVSAFTTTKIENLGHNHYLDSLSLART